MRSFLRRSRSRAVGSTRDDEGSGLILVFLVMLISSALSLVLLENAVSMANQTQSNNKRVTSLAAAQAGLDSALGQIRDATDPATGAGEVATIPCTVAAGAVGGVTAPTAGGSANGSYTVKVAYFAVDPSAQTAAWRSNSANQINCPSGSHPDKVPSFALVTATGVSTAGKPRTVESTYIFTTTNKNISGGLMHVEHGGETGTPDLCPDAGSAHPAVGDSVTMQPCDSNNQGQRWAYQTDLSFLLTSTTNDQLPKAPMCTNVAGNPAPTGTLFKMAVCTGLPNNPGSVTLGQQFSYDDSGRFENSKPNGSNRTLAGTCMNPSTANATGSTLVVGSCGQTWRPEASMGAGMSGDGVNVGQNTMQLVNYKEFGRCLDDTNQTPTYAFLIAYPCKQSPNPTEITWNQKYTYSSANNTISTAINGGSYAGQTWCLNSPLVAEPDINTASNFVTLALCKTSPIPTSQKWVEIGSSTGNYTSDYTIHDWSNPTLCLGVGITGTGVPSASGLGEWSSIYVQTCDGSLGQKWNAPPNVPVGTVTDTHEVGTSSGP